MKPRIFRTFRYTRPLTRLSACQTAPNRLILISFNSPFQPETDSMRLFWMRRFSMDVFCVLVVNYSLPFSKISPLRAYFWVALNSVVPIRLYLSHRCEFRQWSHGSPGNRASSPVVTAPRVRSSQRQYGGSCGGVLSHGCSTRLYHEYHGYGYGSVLF